MLVFRGGSGIVCASLKVEPQNDWLCLYQSHCFRNFYMTAVDSSLLSDLESRGLVSQMTGGGELSSHLSETVRSVYCGFDPTASSLHIGSLVPLLALRRFQLAGHKPIALVGGATGLIGDPSGKTAERSLNDTSVVEEWVECLKKQVSVFVDFDKGSQSAEVVNNLDWFKDMSTLSFLRDVGKHFAVNNMIHKESVKQRIDREGEGISYTEFTYMILQSYDFAELYKRHNCTLQIGGSDQWGNITGGVDLVRRLHGGSAHGLTLPLVTKSDGTKFGKTEQGTIWLDPARTSPYAFYQFWLNVADADVYRFLKYFTFLSVDEIDGIEKEDRSSGAKPVAQSVLATNVTELVHGSEGLESAQRISHALFNSELSSLSENELAQLKQDGIPASSLERERLSDLPINQLFIDADMAGSGKQVKDALSRGAISINGHVVDAKDAMDVASYFDLEKGYFGKYFFAKMGKKKHHLFELV